MHALQQRDRLSKLVRLLSSDTPGEVFAAAQAIKKICTFHDIADAVAAHFCVDNAAPGRAPPAENFAGKFWWQIEAERLLREGALWGDREKSFLQFMRQSQRGPTPARAKWMRDISERTRRAA